jgi:DNA-binding beta-propeller fold protein YncE
VNRREFVALAAAAPFVARAALAAAAPAPAALVTCDTEARLAVVELGSFRVVGSVATLPDPRSVELVGAAAVVCHTAVGAVSIVDAETRRVRHVLRGFVEPRYTAAHPDGVHAYVTDSGRSSVTALDVARGTVLGRVRLPGWARHLTIDEAGRTLWVGLGSASPDLAAVDVSNPALPRRLGIVTPPFAMHDVGFLPGGAHVWVTSGDDGETAIFDLRGRPVLRLRADRAPQHVTFGSGVAFVTSGGSGTLSVQRPATGRVLRTTPIPIGSYNVQYGFGRVLTPSLNHGTLTMLDRRGTLLATIQVAGSCHDACFLPSRRD